MTVDLYLVGAVVGGALLLAVLALVLVVRSAKNIVVPRSASKDLVRRPFSEADVVAMPGLDAIIIGSGIGGLTTAALLARVGWRCLVLEQHDVAGGCTHEWYARPGSAVLAAVRTRRRINRPSPRPACDPSRAVATSAAPQDGERLHVRHGAPLHRRRRAQEDVAGA